MAAISAPATLSPENQVGLATLARMLELASGFTLAFVRVNHASLRDRLVDELLARFPQKNILRLTLRPPLEDGTVVHGVVTQLLDAAGDSRPDAIFVLGLDTMFDPAARDSPALDILNLNRSYLAKRFACPVVFWIAEFGMRELMSRAPDFWRIRSGTYYFVGESEDARSTLARARRGRLRLEPRSAREARAHGDFAPCAEGDRARRAVGHAGDGGGFIPTWTGIGVRRLRGWRPRALRAGAGALSEDRRPPGRGQLRTKPRRCRPRAVPLR